MLGRNVCPTSAIKNYVKNENMSKMSFTFIYMCDKILYKTKS